MNGPLRDLQIVDLTANMAGPYATMVLAEQGADVIKVEPPGGEVIRRIGTGRGGMSSYFANLNRNKRSVVVDLRSAEGVGLVRRLAARADVFVQNFRPGVVERIGIGPDGLCAANPDLIYVSITGYGRDGPLAKAPAYDHVVQALSGMASIQRASADSDPSLVRHGIVDKATGLAVSEAVLAAIVQRTRTGSGSRIEVSMLDVALHFLWPDGMMNNTCLDPVDVLPPISRGFRLTRTANGFLALITVTNSQWEGLVRSVGLGDLLSDHGLADIKGRMQSGGKIMRAVAERLGRLPTDEAVRLLRAHDVPCAPVLDADAVRHNEQVLASGTLQEHDHPVLGRIVQPRPPARFFGEETIAISPAPKPGADTDTVLTEAGFAEAEIARLRESGSIK